MNTLPPYTSKDKPNPETTFIYALVDPLMQQICYIGKANDPESRLKNHMRQCTSTPTRKNNWIKYLKDQGLVPGLRITENKGCLLQILLVAVMGH